MARSRRPTTLLVSRDASSVRCTGALDCDLRRFAFNHLVAFAANGQSRVQNDRVAGDEGVKEMPDCGQVLLAG
jgi:hypothetical protein